MKKPNSLLDSTNYITRFKLLLFRRASLNARNFFGIEIKPINILDNPVAHKLYSFLLKAVLLTTQNRF